MKKIPFPIAFFTALTLCCSAFVPIAGGGELTVSGIEKMGYEPLGDTALRALIIGKTLVVRNRETGELFEATYETNGQRMLKNLTEDQIRKSAAYAFHGGPTPGGIAPYEIREGQLITTFGGNTYRVRVFLVEGIYVANRSGEGDALNWEIIESRPANAVKEKLTESSLSRRGIEPLRDRELKELIVGKTLIVRNRATQQLYEATYSADGNRQVRNITERRLHYLTYQAFHGGSVPEGVAPYKIKNGEVITTFDGRLFTVRVYIIEGKYFGARSGEGGAVNWELVERQ